MENNHLKSFEVSGFKKFTDLKIDNIGQFNLIVGDNNVGKTSLLEALLVNQNPENFFDSLANLLLFVKRFNNLRLPYLNYFFSDSSKKNLIEISEIDSEGIAGNYFYYKKDDFNFEVSYTTNGLITPPRMFSLSNESYLNMNFNLNVPFIPFGNYYDHELTEKYSQHIQIFVDKKDQFLKAFSKIIPNIKNIEVNAGLSKNPILLIAEAGRNQLTPLGMYGDGALKLFRILISLFSGNNIYSRLMIDELDAGIHHSRLNDFIKSLINVGLSEGKQIFATTHSKECIESFKTALEEAGLQNEGRIIRLAETKNGIKAYTNTFEQFENSLSAESEIR